MTSIQKENKISFYYQNTRGLRTKTNLFYRNLCLTNHDVILLTETWLLDGIADSELFDSRYLVWRRDRDYDLTRQTRGGGVLIATHKNLTVTPRPSFQSSAEDLWLTITLNNNCHSKPTNLHVCVLYLCNQHCGNSFANQLTNFLDKVEQVLCLYPDDKILIVGDFNLSGIQWIPNYNYFKPVGNNTYEENLLLDNLNMLGLNQYNGILNSYGKILDLVLCNDDLVVSSCSNPLVTADNHHGSLIIETRFINFTPLLMSPRKKFLFTKGNYDAINEELISIDWTLEFSTRSFEESIEFFYSVFRLLRDRHIPSKFVNNKNFPTWYSPSLKKVIKEQYKHYRKFKQYGNRCDLESMKLLRSRAKDLESKCYSDYVASIENSIVDNPKNFFGFVKARLKSNVMPNTMTYRDILVNTGESICKAFSDYFESNFINSGNQKIVNDSLDNLSSTSDVSSIFVSQENVYKLLQKLDPSKSAGPDELPAVFIIKCAKSLTVPVTLLFRRSFSECTVPLIWKSAYITPVHKKGPKTDILNYRPISKLCILSKVLEKIVHTQVYAGIRCSLNDFQHGFLPGRSTVSNLVLFNDFLTQSMDRGFQVDTIYTDYSKAFDRINHSRLLLKLESIGIRGDLLRWFTSYIDNRSQAVVINNYISGWVQVPSGVPQGSLLGPLLFVIFINDINTCLHASRMLCFADDMKIFARISSVQDAHNLQADLLRLQSYCDINSLDLNPLKCSVVTFSRKINNIAFDYSIGNSVLPRESLIRDLGVLHDSKLLFNGHVENIINRAYKALGFVMRTSRDFVNAKTFKILYCTYVRSTLEYASQIWNPRYNTYISRIERIQTKFLKYLCYRLKYPFNSDLYHNCCRKFHILPLKMRRDIADIVFLLRVASGHLDCPELLGSINFRVPRSYRRNVPLFLPQASTNYRQNSFIYRSSKQFNHLAMTFDVDIFNTSITTVRGLMSGTFFKCNR